MLITMNETKADWIDFPTVVKRLAHLANRQEIRTACGDFTGNGIVSPTRLGTYRLLTEDEVSKLERHFQNRKKQ